MLDLHEKIKGLAQEAKMDIDLLDVGITLTVAMTQEQQEDLAAMIEHLSKTEMSPHEILYNALHDLQGLKAIYLGDPHGECFCPRSNNYRKKVS